MAINLANADELLTTPRAVRKRIDLTRPVPREVILDCIRVSQQAPTGSNSQGWRFVVVTDDPGDAAGHVRGVPRDMPVIPDGPHRIGRVVSGGVARAPPGGPTAGVRTDLGVHPPRHGGDRACLVRRPER